MKEHQVDIAGASLKNVAEKFQSAMPSGVQVVFDSAGYSMRRVPKLEALREHFDTQNPLLPFPEGIVLPPRIDDQLKVEYILERFVSRTDVVGIEHLRTARDHLNDNSAIIFAGNHISNGDGPIANRVIRRNGRMSPVFPIGRKLLDGEKTKGLTRSVATIPVWPPTISPTSAERPQFAAWTRNALHVAEMVLRTDNKDVICIFPEGTRTRTGKLGKGVPAVGKYFSLAHGEKSTTGLTPKNDTVVVPFILDGMDDILPVDADYPVMRGPVSMRFLEPISVKAMQELYNGSHNMNEAMVDHVMIEIAKELPEGTRGPYEQRAAI